MADKFTVTTQVLRPYCVVDDADTGNYALVTVKAPEQTVAAERVTARDRRVDEPALAQGGDGIRQRERQARTVGHHVCESGAREALLERGRDCRCASPSLP